MAVRKYTKEEKDYIMKIVNENPGCYKRAAEILSPELNRSVDAIRVKIREIKKDYPAPCVVGASGVRTPSGVTSWQANNPPEFRTIRRWQNIKHLFFN